MRAQHLVCLALLVPSMAYAEADWKWTSGDVSPSGWSTAQGVASVELKGGRLEGRLYGADRLRPAQTLIGSVTSGQVNAVRRVHGSGVGDETMRGTYAQMRHGDSIYEAIIVQTQWGFLGITRTVRDR